MRLRDCLNELISNLQSVIVKDRQILDLAIVQKMMSKY